MSVEEQYTAEMRKQFGYSAAWAPIVEVRLGDVGRLRNYAYERVRTLKEFGITFKVRKDPAIGLLEYTSEGSVSFDVLTAGNLPAQPGVADAEARVVVSFSRGEAVFFQASNCLTTSIEDQHALGQSLLKLYKAGEWLEDYVVVTEVIRAKRSTVLISNGSNAVIEFAAEGEVKLGNHTLVDADVELRVARTRNIGTRIIAEPELTPLFKAMGIKKRFLRQPTVGRRGERSQSSGSGDEGRDVFIGEVDYQDYA